MVEKIHNKLLNLLDATGSFILWVYPAIIIAVGAVVCKRAVSEAPAPVGRLLKSIILSAIVSIVAFVTLIQFSWAEKWVAVSIFFCALVADYVLEAIVIIGENFVKQPEKNLAKFGRYVASLFFNRR